MLFYNIIFRDIKKSKISVDSAAFFSKPAHFIEKQWSGHFIFGFARFHKSIHPAAY